MSTKADTDISQDIRKVLAPLMDPEIPVISLFDLGIIRDITPGPPPMVTITPTYMGCPATDMITGMIRRALEDNGLGDVQICNRLSPAWTTEWISEAGKAALKAYGIDPPGPHPVTCPRCGSTRTQCVSQFGSTPCKALYKCEDCLEPFDRFKCH